MGPRRGTGREHHLVQVADGARDWEAAAHQQQQHCERLQRDLAAQRSEHEVATERARESLQHYAELEGRFETLTLELSRIEAEKATLLQQVQDMELASTAAGMQASALVLESEEGRSATQVGLTHLFSLTLLCYLLLPYLLQ